MANQIFRAAVVDAKDRLVSGVWQFLSNRDEVYISLADIASQCKTSLHSSERYRTGFTTQQVSDAFRAEGLDRAVHKWTPLPLTSTARVPFQVVTPAAGIGTNANYIANPDIYRLPMPDNDDALVLSVIEAPSPVTSELLGPDAQLIHQWPTIGGRHIGIVIHTYTPSVTELNQWRDFITARPEFNLPWEKCEDEKGAYDPRATMDLEPGEGMYRVMEFGLREMAMWATFTAHRSN